MEIFTGGLQADDYRKLLEIKKIYESGVQPSSRRSLRCITCMGRRRYCVSVWYGASLLDMKSLERPLEKNSIGSIFRKRR